MDNKIKLGIGIPSGSGMVNIKFATSLMALRLPEDTRVIVSEKVMVHTAREDIVDQLIGDRDYILFLDDDMIFDSDLALKLLEHKKDVIGGLAFQRRKPFFPCIFKEKEGKYYPIIRKTNQVFEVDAIGLAGTLIRVEVFKKLPKPWFYFTKEFSEDFNFSRSVKKAGFRIWCDPSVLLQHIGDPQIISEIDFLKYLNEKEKNKNSNN